MIGPKKPCCERLCSSLEEPGARGGRGGARCVEEARRETVIYSRSRRMEAQERERERDANLWVRDPRCALLGPSRVSTGPTTTRNQAPANPASGSPRGSQRLRAPPSVRTTSSSLAAAAVASISSSSLQLARPAPRRTCRARVKGGTAYASLRAPVRLHLYLVGNIATLVSFPLGADANRTCRVEMVVARWRCVSYVVSSRAFALCTVGQRRRERRGSAEARTDARAIQ